MPITEDSNKVLHLLLLYMVTWNMISPRIMLDPQFAD
jgi:hypothetical protein